MSCCSSNIRILQVNGGVSPFSFEVTAGTGPSPLGPITSGPFIVDNTVYGFHQTSPGNVRTKVNPTQEDSSILMLKKIG